MTLNSVRWDGRWLQRASSLSSSSACSLGGTTAAFASAGAQHCVRCARHSANGMRGGSVSDGVSKQKLFGHRICNECVGTRMHSRFGAITLLNASRDARSPGDGLTEESYREKMFEQSEEREEMREALMSEGAETRLGVYAEVQGEEAAAQQRKPREKKKKKKKKKKKAEEVDEEEEEAGEEEAGEEEGEGYEDEDAAELARQAQEERVARLEEGAEEEEEDEDEYGGLE